MLEEFSFGFDYRAHIFHTTSSLIYSPLFRSDPYVKFELEKDNWVFDKSYGKMKSSKKKNTCNPEYNETFTFDDVPSTDNLRLCVKVMDVSTWDFDCEFGTNVPQDDVGLDDAIGDARIDLEKLRLSSNPQEVVRVVDHKRGSFFSRKAKIHLHVSYVE